MDLERVVAALRRQGYDFAGAELRADGSRPVLRTDRCVAKLFPLGDSESLDYDTEIAAYRSIADVPVLPAPTLLAAGIAANCRYLILSRAPGTTLLEVSADAEARQRLAEQLGRVVASIHGVRPRAAAAGDGRLGRDWLREHGSATAAARRHRAWQTLPARLVEQIESYAVPPNDRALVHADLAVDHVFVQDGELTAVVDWGGAEWTDPFYELPILHFDLFAADKRLLAGFLDGYGGMPAEDFVRRAMSAALCHESDVFETLSFVRPDIEFEGFESLDALADGLWRT